MESPKSEREAAADLPVEGREPAKRKGREPVRLTIVHTSSLLNLRGSEFWVMDVSSLLGAESFAVRVVNFDYARRYPRDPEEIRLRLAVIAKAFGKGVPLIRPRTMGLRLPFGRLWRGTSLEAAVDRYLHFLPLSRPFLRVLHDSDLVYFVVSQGSPAYLMAAHGASALARWRPVVAGIHVTPRFRAQELALLKLAAKAGLLRAVHTVNESHEAELKRIGCRVECIPNGVRYEAFASDVEKKAAQRRFTVLFVGAMTWAKGADLLPAIHRSLRSQGVDSTLVLCTSGGELAGEMMKWAEGKPDVQYRGYVERSELSKLYAQASVAVFPSRREGSPLACLEAQASGTPVVVSDLPGLTQSVVEGETGSVAGGADPESFARAIGRLYSVWTTERGRYLDMCRSAQANVRENFQWSVTIKALGRLLRSARRGADSVPRFCRPSLARHD